MDPKVRFLLFQLPYSTISMHETIKTSLSDPFYRHLLGRRSIFHIFYNYDDGSSNRKTAHWSCSLGFSMQSPSPSPDKATHEWSFLSDKPFRRQDWASLYWKQYIKPNPALEGSRSPQNYTDCNRIKYENQLPSYKFSVKCTWRPVFLLFHVLKL